MTDRRLFIGGFQRGARALCQNVFNTAAQGAAGEHTDLRVGERAVRRDKQRRRHARVTGCGEAVPTAKSNGITAKVMPFLFVF